MNNKARIKTNELSIQGRDNLVSVFKLLMEIDKKQNPELYKLGKNNSMVVLGKDGRKITL